MPSIKELLDQRMALVTQARAVLAKADSEDKRDLTAEETAAYDAIDSQIDAVSGEIDKVETDNKRREKLAGLEASIPVARQTGSGNLAGLGSTAAQAIEIELRGRRLHLRPGSSEHLRAQPDYQEKFGRYLVNGEQLGLQVSSDPKGGYLAPTTWVASLIKFLDDEVFMRRLATVLPPLMQAASLGVPSYDTDPNDADWGAEVPASDISEDTAMAFGKRELTPHLCTKLIKLSTKILRSAILDVDSFTVGRVGYKFAVTEEKAFLSGTGAQRPLGVFEASADGVSTGRDKATASTTTFTADELIDNVYNIKDAYRSRATWVAHRDFYAKARKLKDGNGQYLWQPSVQAGQPDMLFNIPTVSSEFAPNTFTTGKYIAIVGDFKAGYWIVDSLEMEVQRLGELFSLKNQVGILGRKETDGMPVLEEAFSRMKLA